MKLHKRYPLNRLSAINTTTLLLLMGCAGVGRKPTEAPIEFDATPTSVDGYLAHLEYDENAAFEVNQELYDVDIVDGPADITFSLEIEHAELASLVEIHPQTGVITAVGDFSPDYDDGEQEFEITVVASTQRQQVRQTIKVTINDINDEAPTFSATPADSSSIINENSQYSAKFQALPDAALDGVTIRYGLSGDDARFFDIDTLTGQLSSKSDTVFDHESGKTEYRLKIIATTYHLVDGLPQPASYNGEELVTELDISITVSDINEIAPLITSSASGPALAENTEVATDTAVYRAEGSYDATPIVWSLKGNNGDDASLFNIDATSGVVTFKQATTPDHESGKTSYSFTVVATSGDFITEKDVTISVTDLNDVLPSISSAASVDVAENTVFATTTAIYEAKATPDVANDKISWSFKDNEANDDASLFDIDSSSGVVTFKEATTPDHESGKTSYSFTIVATTGELSSEKTVTIFVTNAADTAPSFTGITPSQSAIVYDVAENTSFSQSFAASPDVSTDTVSYSLSGTDAALFEVSSAGLVTSKSTTSFDYESGKTSYAFTVTASTGSGNDILSSTQDVTITVTDVAPSASFAANAVTSFTIEDRTTVFDAVTFSASPVGTSQPIIYGLAAVAGKETDIDAFTIDASTGVLTAASRAEFHHNDKASYEIYITAKTSASAEPALHKVTVTIDGPAESTFIKMPVNTPHLGSTIYGTSGTDVIDGTEVHDFINAGSGDDTITTNNGANGGDIIIGGYGKDTITLEGARGGGIDQLIYRFDSTDWTATDGGDVVNGFNLTVDKLLFVDVAALDGVSSVNDFIDGLIAAGGSIRFTTDTVPSGETNAGASYIDGIIFTFAKAGTIDGASNTASSGKSLTLNFSPITNYANLVQSATTLTTALGANLTVTSSSTATALASLKSQLASLTDDADSNATIDVTRDMNPSGLTFNEGPVFTSGRTKLAVAENGALTAETYAADYADNSSGTGRLDATLSLFGADADLFDFNATTGVLTAKSTTSFDYETKSSYEVFISAVGATDDIPMALMRVDIIVANQNDEAPEITSDATSAISLTENTLYEKSRVSVDANGTPILGTDNLPVTTGGATVYEAKGTYDATPIVWSLKANNNDDAGLFEIHEETGVVTVASDFTPDHETKDSYGFTVIATSGGYTAEKDITVAVTDVNDVAPVISSDANISVDENTVFTTQTAIYRAEGRYDVTPIEWSFKPNNSDDAGLFDIDAASGVVTFKQATTPDHESGKTSYSFTVVATSGDLATEQAVTITVTDLNDVAPVITSLTSGTALVENTQIATSTAIYRAQGTYDATPIFWSFKGSNNDDASLFNIDSSSGVVTFKQSTTPDYEDKESYAFTVVATSGNFEVEKAVTIAVTNVNDVAPSITSLSSGTALVENTEVAATTTIYSATATPDVSGDNIIWSLKDNNSDDADLFEISSNGVVTFRQATTPDHEDKDSYSFTVVAKTGDLSSEKAVTIAVTDLNDVAPVISSDANVSVDENTVFTTQTAIYRAEGRYDVTPIEWSFKPNNSDDAGLFDIDAASGVVTFKQATTPDHESGKTSYAFTVVAKSGDLDTEKAVTITVTDLNEVAPVITSLTSGTALVENTQIATSTAIYRAQGTYDATPIVWSFKGSNNDDASLFNIDSSSGVVTFKQSTTPDYEDKESYAFTVVATSGNFEVEKAVTIAVTNVNDVAPSITSLSSGTALVENTEVAATTTIYSATATPDVSGDNIIWSLKDNNSDDADLFEISSNGVVTFRQATTPDHEDKDSYSFTVVAKTGDLSSEKAVTIAVTDLNDVAPVISSDASGEIAENTTFTTTTAIYTATGTYDATPIVWSLKASNNDDAGLFDIDSATGAVTFKQATTPDYESGKTSYAFTVVATSGNLSSEKDITISVTDVVNDMPPTFTTGASTISVKENASFSESYAATYQIEKTELVGSEIVKTNVTEDALLSLGGKDAAYFQLSADGILTPKFSSTSAPGTNFDYESKSSYEITITASAPLSSDTANIQDLVRKIVINVENQNDVAPLITSDASGDIAENTAFTTTTAVYTAEGTPDVAGDSILWSLKGGNSDDAGLFDIDSATGVVTFKQATTPDHESGKTSYTFTIVAKTGELSSEKEVTIAVTDVNDEAPVITSDATGTALLDNTEVATSTSIYTATGTYDVTPIAWSLKGNNSDDAGLFDINSSSGAVTFKQATTPDHESGKTSYAFTIVATSGNLSSEQDVTIAVTDVNEAPVITSSDSGAALTENQLVAVTQTLYTAEGDYDLIPIVWSIDRSKQDDGGLFTIDTGTGEVRFANATQPNYEAQDSYNFTIIATSGEVATAKTVTIAVTDVNDTAPVITSSASGVDLAESMEVATTTAVYNATATPDIAGDPVSWSFKTTDADGNNLYDDADLFDIDSSSGVVTFKQATTPDYEDKDSYSFTVIATTGGPSSEKTVTVTVSDVNDMPPVFAQGTQATITVSDRTTTFEGVTYQAVADVASVPVTYTIEAITGKEADIAPFQIDATTGELTAASNAEFVRATKSSYEFNIIATAGSQTATQKVVVTVAPVEQSTFLSALPGAKGDVLFGQALGDEFLEGSALSDIIIGGSGDNTINTNNNATGGDIILGGLGDDTIALQGSNGANANQVVYRFNSETWLAFDGADVVSNFDRGIDKLLFIDLAHLDGMMSFESFVDGLIAGGGSIGFTTDTVPLGSDAGSHYIDGLKFNFATGYPFQGDVLTIAFTDPASDYSELVALAATLRTLLGDDLTADSDSGATTLASFKTHLAKLMSDSDNNHTIDVTRDITPSDIEVLASHGPSISGARSIAVAEGGNFSEIYTALDPDGSYATFRLEGTDAQYFTITPRTFGIDKDTEQTYPSFEYELKAKYDQIFNYEQRTHYEVNVIAVPTDSALPEAVQRVVITVTDVNETPSVVVTGSQYVIYEGSYDEPADTGYNILVSDDDGTTPVITVSDDRFEVTSDGSLRVKTGASFDYEASANPVILLTITATDADDNTLTATDEVSIVITNANDVAPVFTSGATSDILTEKHIIRDTTPVYQAVVKSDGSHQEVDDITAPLFSQVSITPLANSDEDVLYKNPISGSDEWSVFSRMISNESVIRDGFVRFTVDDTDTKMDLGIALVAQDNTISHYGLYFDAGTLYISEEGNRQAHTLTGDAATYQAGDIFAVQREGDKISYYNLSQDAVNPIHTSTITTYGRLHADFDVFSTGQVASEISFASGALPLAYALKDGQDASLFDIDSATGAVTFKDDLVPDFETRSDYEITIIVRSGSLVTEQAVTLNVGNVQETAPVITSPATAVNALAENTEVATTTTIYTATGTSDAVDIVWSLKDHGNQDDAGLFTIDATTGVVTFKSATTPDYEAQSSYHFTITATAASFVTEQHVTVNVADQNDAPIIVQNAVPDFDDRKIGLSHLFHDPDGDNLTFELVSGPNRWTVSGNEITIPNDDSTIGNVTVEVKATDPDGLSVTTSFILAVNSGRNFVTLNRGSYSIEEGVTTSRIEVATIFRVSTSYELSVNDDRFEVINQKLYIKSGASFDYETDGSSIEVGVLGIASATRQTAARFTLNLTNANDEAPVITSLSHALAIPDGTAFDPTEVLYTATGTADSGTITWSLKNNGFADDARFFTIDATTGEVKAQLSISTTAQNFDGDVKGSYSFTIIATVGDQSAERVVTLTIPDANDELPSITSGDTGSVVFDENTTQAAGTEVYSATGTYDRDDILWRIKDNGFADDGKLFSVDTATGKVTLSSAITPDYEAKSSYQFTIVASSGGLKPVEKIITIGVKDINDNPPVITSGDTASHSYAVDGQTHFIGGQSDFFSYYKPTGTYDVTPITWSIKQNNNDDGALFQVNSNTGYVGSKQSITFDYETKPSYHFTIVATSGSYQVEKDITLHVRNVLDTAPIITSSATPQVDEGAFGTDDAIYTATATPDLAGDRIAWSFKPNNNDDANLFEIGSNGAVTFKDATEVDFETDTKLTYEFTVIAATGRYQSEQDVTLSFVNVNEAPIYIGKTIYKAHSLKDATHALPSGSYGQDYYLDMNDYFTDPDGDPLTFSLAFKGNNNRLEPIVNLSSDGIMTTNRHGDGSRALIDEIIVTATDAGGKTASRELSFVYSGLVVDFTPAQYTLTEGENVGNITLGTISVPNRFWEDKLQVDDDRFEITSDLVLRTKADADFDFETEGDAIRLIISMVDNEIDTQFPTYISVTEIITLTNAADTGPSFTGITPSQTAIAYDVAENTSFSQSFAASPDVSTDTVSYSLSGTDAASFEVSSAGLVTNKSTTAFDYEGGKTSYAFTVTASTGSGNDVLSSTQDVTITVTDVAPSASFAANAVTSFTIEDRTTVFDAVTFSASPVGTSQPIIYGLAAVAGKETDIDAFTIDASTGVLTAASRAEFHHNDKASYEIYITAKTSASAEPALHKVTVTIDGPAESTFIKMPVNTPHLGSTIYGTSGTDVIDGTEVHDFINAGSGDDTITTNNGANGGDIIIGGYGKDTITLEGARGGGIDQLIYRFDSTDWTATDGGDVVNGFNLTVDKLLFVDVAALDGVSSVNDFIDGLIAAGGSIRFTTDTVPSGETNAGASYIDGIIFTFAKAGTIDGASNTASSGKSLTLNFSPITNYANLVQSATTLTTALGANLTVTSSSTATALASLKSQLASLTDDADSNATIDVTRDMNPSGLTFNEGPVFTSGRTKLAVAENGTLTAETYAADYADNSSTGTGRLDATLSLFGADADLFDFNATTGVLTAKSTTSFDYETKSSYEVFISAVGATDDIPMALMRVDIIVANQNDEAPEITSDATSAISLTENTLYEKPKVSVDANGTPILGTDNLPVTTGGATVYEAKGTYDATPIVWSLKANNNDDAGLFEIHEETGVVTVASDFTPDHETKDSYGFTVIATSGDYTAEKDITVAVTDVNDVAPVISYRKEDFGHNIVYDDTLVSSGYPYFTLSATYDVTPVTWSLTGRHANLFTINATNQVILKRTIKIDHERIPTYEFTAVATSGTLTDTVDLSIDVIDQNDNPPVFTSLSTGTIIDDNTEIAANTTIYTAAATPDVAGDTVRWSLKNNGTNDDAGLFEIDSNGHVTFKIATTPDVAAQDSYRFTIIASVNGSGTHSGRNTSAEQTVTLSVEIDATPVISSDASVSTLAHGKAVDGDFVVYDGEATSDSTAAITWSLKDNGTNDDGKLFDIDTATGEVSFVATSTTPNYGSKNQYEFTIIATQGSKTAEQDITVKVNALDLPTATRSGTTGSDTVNGTSASETVQGGDHNDIISTGGGGDTVFGGYGRDTITLGDGADTVVVRFNSNSDDKNSYHLNDGGDVIHNFEFGVDRLVLVDVNTTNPITSFSDFEPPADGILIVLATYTGTGSLVTGISIQFSTGGQLTANGGGAAGNILTINFDETDTSNFIDTADTTQTFWKEDAARQIFYLDNYDYFDDVFGGENAVAVIDDDDLPTGFTIL